ncbi:MAG: DUF1640 domain-containing protein [Methylobacter sp.]|nr:DUF1640 domain-containing protein [Methylobacter sp.]
MTTLTFDTHQFIRTLQDAGFEQPQAEAVANAFKAATGQSDLATQSDIDLVRRDIRESELRLETKISDIKYDLVKWIAGMLLAQAGLVAALVKLL